MTLNHLNLTVTDALEAAQFLEKYFGMRPPEGSANSRTFAVVFDEAGFVLTFIRGKKGVDIVYPPTFHIGFSQPSPEHVNEIHARLKADGFDVPEPTQQHAWTFYFTAPGGYTIEVLG